MFTAVTIHSRAARRAASPSLNLDKASAKPAHTTRDSASPSRPSQVNPHALAAKDGGIRKKQNKGNMTRAQRLRHQKGLERAEENSEKLALKRAKSRGKEQKIKERAKGWEDVNGDGTKKSKKEVALDELKEEAKRREREWVSDEEMDDEEAGAQNGVAVEPQAGDIKGENKQVESAVPASVPLAVEEDEML
jgi:hypothetical protein